MKDGRELKGGLPPVLWTLISAAIVVVVVGGGTLLILFGVMGSRSREVNGRVTPTARPTSPVSPVVAFIASRTPERPATATVEQPQLGGPSPDTPIPSRVPVSPVALTPSSTPMPASVPSPSPSPTSSSAPSPSPSPTLSPSPSPSSTSSPTPAGTPVSEPREEDYVLKVGILGPFSGPSSRTGDELHASATMAFEEIGWQIGAYTIEPVWIDSQSDPAQAALAYEEAIVQDGIEAGILNWHSSVSVSCMELTAQYQVPHLFGLGGTGVVNEVFQSDPDYYGYWMLKGWPEPQKLNIAYVQALEDAIDQGIWSPEAKTVAIGGEDTDWGRDFGAAIAEQFDTAGWEILAEEYLPVDQTYFYPLLYDLIDLNPAVVAGSSTSVSAMMSFINQADEVGLESLLIVDGLGWMGEWYELTGESSDYILDQAPGWPTAEAEEFAVDFEERWGFTPSPAAAGLAYDGSRFFIAVAQAAYQEYDVLTSESIYTFVKENVWTGEWTYTEGIMMESYAATPETVPDPVVGNGYYILPVLQYFDGEGVVIYPPVWAEQELTPPGEVLSSDP